ncbi:MAG: hypothetical protein RBT80_22905 [Candidatus Vecturithrix sp.]|jgi:hypothetical protein|nr:hypothetical protein [Candidatus Vecturithrix sp.]
MMNVQTITLHISNDVYRRIQRTAQLLKQPLETLLVNTVQTALPLVDDLPVETVADLTRLTLLNDAALWRKANATLPTEQQSQLTMYLEKKNSQPLTMTEQQALESLLEEHDRLVLIRSQAAVLLKQRGYDVSSPTSLRQPFPIP